MKPKEATQSDLFVVCICLAFFIGVCIVMLGFAVIGQHEDTQLIVLETTKLLKADIAELRAELKAHDTKPEWFEREE